MIAFGSHPAHVPDELYPLVDDQFSTVQERWQNATFEGLLPDAPTLFPVAISDTERILMSRLSPAAEADGSVIGLSFPFQQGLNRTMLLRAAFMQQSIAPNSEVLLFPNVHTGKDSTFSLSGGDKARLAEGSLAPVAEKLARAIEVLGVGSIALTGYSQGARMSLDIAGANPNFEITHLNMDEAPSAPERSAKQLQKDFLRSGTLDLQRKSMSEAGYGTLLEQTAKMLPIDYAKFGIGTLSAVSRLMHKGMTGSMSETLKQVSESNPDMAIKVGVVGGSYLTDTSDLVIRSNHLGVARGVRYTGDAANAHATGDNYAAHALMVKDGLQ